MICVGRVVGVLGVLGLIACSPPPGAAHAPQAPAAEPPLALPPGVGEPGSTVLIGDLHGTREIPAFVGRLVATLVARQPVVLALEIPREVAPSLDAFLASDGGRAARDAFTRGPWWRAEYQDGRRSVAMLELIDTARRLRAAGANLRVACIDMPATDPGQAQTRDNAMAEQVMELRAAQPGAVLVVYAGNIHTRKAALPRRPDYATMAMRMAAGMPHGGANGGTPRSPEAHRFDRAGCDAGAQRRPTRRAVTGARMGMRPDRPNSHLWNTHVQERQSGLSALRVASRKSPLFARPGR